MSDSNKDTQYQTPLAGARQCLSIKTAFINYYIIWTCFFVWIKASIDIHFYIFPDLALSCDTTSLILSGTTLPSSLVPKNISNFRSDRSIDMLIAPDEMVGQK